MKVSDYIVNYLIEKGITDVFGYPGGMVTHLMESFRKYEGRISAHVTYHEQGAAFAACGYAQISGKPGVAYATSGPGATNLITGIANAYFDSIPCIFISGQVNSFESKNNYKVRQRGFQETEVVSMVKGITKYSAYVEAPEKIKMYLDKAFYEAMSNRKGPVLLDIPMNVFRSEIDIEDLEGYDCEIKSSNTIDAKTIVDKAFKYANRPILLLGNGVKSARVQEKAKNVIESLNLPFVTSMIAFDVIPNNPWNMGFIGAYGARSANFAIAKSDLVIAIGSRLDVRQVGAKRENFAPDAQIIRVDIDTGELEYKVHENEVQINCTIDEFFDVLAEVELEKDYNTWRKICEELKKRLFGIDDRLPNKIVRKISKMVPEKIVVTTDVGQNQVWIAQSFELNNQQVLFSGGHGAMGYSFPAAIGACYASEKKPVVCFSGDGGFQMNIQELQFIAREQIPVKIIILNNNALGMIRHFQEMYFDSKYYQTKPEGGYDAPNFSKIADAYGIRSMRISDIEDIKDWSILEDDKPLLLDIVIDENTYVFPKLEFGKPNQDQEPLLSRELYQQLMDL